MKLKTIIGFGSIGLGIYFMFINVRFWITLVLIVLGAIILSTGRGGEE